VHVVVPGSLRQRTGGYLYDARMVDGMRALGWRVGVVELDGGFPDADAAAVEAFGARLADLPAGQPVVVDGLAGGAHPEVLRRAARARPVLSLVHHPLGDERGVEPGTRRRLLQRERAGLDAVHGVVVTSPFTARRLRELGVDGERIRVVVPGTEVPPGAPAAAAAPGPGTQVAEPDAAPSLLCLGTVTPRKGQDLLVAALGGLAELPWRCALVGSLERDPAFAGRVRAQVEELGLGGRVVVAGEVDEAELEEWWSRSHLFVLPSWYEGYGMALAEALARGLPVVSTRAGAIPDTVPPGAGHLVPPGDVDGLRETLARLLSQPARRRALAAGARRHAAALPGWAEQARAFAAAVSELVDGV
jgi:glycosyltransferase involved in cell wall biosynthesis